jgi:hypothetical protein
MTGVELIAAERQRQIDVEGWTPEHDDANCTGQLCFAARSYVAEAINLTTNERLAAHIGWPWQREWWKPSDDPIKNLVKAGALIAAEMDRLQRKALQESISE